MSPIANVAIVALGGAIGSALRYIMGLSGGISSTKCLSTLIVNVLGCFFIGILYAVFSRWDLAQQWRLLLMVGVLGGFTTFSSYALDAVTMAQSGEVLRAAIYVAITNLGGILAAVAGAYATGYLLKNIV